MKTINAWLSEYNALFKTNEKMYREAVKTFGISESAFWILYALRNASECMTQREIVHQNFLPPQTINSALKKLETEGIIEMHTGADRRTKQVCLTPEGEALTARSADRLIDIEIQASEQLTQKEQDEFLRIFRKYISAVQGLLSADIQAEAE